MRFVRFILSVGLTTVLVLAAIDVAARAAFPHLARLEADFSSAYLTRVLREDRGRAPIVVLGDSALWGYRLQPRQIATSLLTREGWPIENLAYQGGSTANTYAMLRVLLAAGVRPRTLVFNVNLKEFNADDSAYQTLEPSVERLAWPLLAASERRLLIPHDPHTLDARINDALGRVWFLYGARSDIRDYLWGQTDLANAVKTFVNGLSGESARAAAAHVPTPEKFFGTYDLDPIATSNVEWIFLRKTVALIAREGIPSYAILTPTNHRLLAEYIDNPAYQAQLAYVAALLRAHGIKVLNYDARFPGRDFLDNDHLTADGNRKLAAMLARDVRR